MSPVPCFIAFALAAGLITVTPGPDTAPIARIAIVEGRRPALLAGAGILGGCLCRSVLASLGSGAVPVAGGIGLAFGSPR